MTPEDCREPFKMTTLALPGGLELHSASPVTINGWLIQVSVTSFDTILVIMRRKDTEFVMSYFTEEEKANEYINFWVSV